MIVTLGEWEPWERDREVSYFLSCSKMSRTKKPSPSSQKRSLQRLSSFNNMVKKAVYLDTHYPGLEFLPIKNFFGGRGTYDVLWHHNNHDIHIAVLKEDTQLTLLTPDPTVSFFENLKRFKGMFDLECSDEYWKSLMRDLVRHNLEKKVWCGEKCEHFPLCSKTYNVIKPWSHDMG